ncbi:dipeptidase [Gilvibacter sp.]|uniref:dipeptidase n=1 Tax=Gilvibacter sp. TaxID=2729997 RepID=UPI003F49DEA0
MSEADFITKATDIHRRVVTLDSHCDIDLDHFTATQNYSQDLDTQISLPKMTAGGLDVAWLIVYTQQGVLSSEGYSKAYDNALSKFEAIHRLCERYAPNNMALALSSKDVKRIHALGKKAIMIGIENGYPIGNDLRKIEEFYDLGGRYMSLSHNGHNQLCDSHTGELGEPWLHNGLSDFGKEAIAELNKCGIMIDVSHLSKKSMEDIITCSKTPIIASHSSARTLCDHSRNLDNQQLQWLKANGGVVQTVAFKSYLNNSKYAVRQKAEIALVQRIASAMNIPCLSEEQVMKLPMMQRRAYFRKHVNNLPLALQKQFNTTDLPPAVDVTDLVDHIDHIVDKIGVDHVGISSDFDGGGGIAGWDDASETFNVTLELVKRGYTEAQIEKLWSGNLMRVLDEVSAFSTTD